MTIRFPGPQHRRVLALVLITGALLLPMLGRALSWIEPSATPPAGAQPEFLNASAAAQRKLGALLVKTAGSGACTTADPSGCTLCLNADANNGTRDATNCIRTWSDIGSKIGGPFVRLLAAGDTSTDVGYARFRGNADNRQFISAILRPSSTATSGASLFARSSSDSQYAGQFDGTVAVIGGRLCLNGTDDMSASNPGGHCIGHWTDLVNTPVSDIVRLQTVTASVPYLYPDVGAVAVDGVAVFKTSLVLGQPLNGTSPQYTRSDGWCSWENGETHTNSPEDCP